MKVYLKMGSIFEKKSQSKTLEFAPEWMYLHIQRRDEV